MWKYNEVAFIKGNLLLSIKIKNLYTLSFGKFWKDGGSGILEFTKSHLKKRLTNQYKKTKSPSNYSENDWHSTGFKIQADGDKPPITIKPIKL